MGRSVVAALVESRRRMVAAVATLAVLIGAGLVATGREYLLTFVSGWYIG